LVGEELSVSEAAWRPLVFVGNGEEGSGEVDMLDRGGRYREEKDIGGMLGVGNCPESRVVEVVAVWSFEIWWVEERKRSVK
jgi:hypothetical protein